MNSRKSDGTFSRIVDLRLKLDAAIEAGEPTAELRQAIQLLEAQIMQERNAELLAEHAARTERAKAAEARANAIATNATEAVAAIADQFTLKD